MKVVAVCGSPRMNGNTEQALNIVLEKVKLAGIDTELIRLAGKKVRGCIACGQCREKRDGKCHGVHDDLNAVIDSCAEADAIIFGSPVYFGSATPEIKALIDRLGFSAKCAETRRLDRKLGGAVVVARRAGHNFTLAQIAQFFGIMGMVQIGSSYWNIGFGREKGDIMSDAEGVGTFEKYGENLAWAMQKLK